MSRRKRQTKRRITTIAGMVVRTRPLTAKPPHTRKVRKQPPAPVKQFLPAPLQRNSAGFGKGWIGGSLYIAATDAVIPKAALDSMRNRNRG